MQLSGGAFPRYTRNFGTGEAFGTATRAVRLRFEIRHRSRVLLPRPNRPPRGS